MAPDCPGARRLRRLAAPLGALLALTVTLTGLGPLPLAHAEGNAWSEPVQVSKAAPGMKEWFPDVAADDQGHVHLVWNTAHVREDEDYGKLQYVRLDSQGWSAPADVAVIVNGSALRSAVAVDTTNRVHLLYKGYGDLDLPTGGTSQDLWYTSAPGDRAEHLAAWSKPVLLTRLSNGYFPALALDSRGGIHALWTEGDATGKFGLYYAHSIDGGQTWSERIPLETQHLVWWYRAQLLVDAQDRVHVAWEVANPELGSESLGFGTTAGARYAISTDRGDTWSTTTFNMIMTSNVLRSASPDATPPGPQQPAVGVDGNGVVLLVYREPRTNRVLYRRSADGHSWSEPQPVPGVRAGVDRPFDVYSLATDSAGHVHLAFVAYPGTSDTMALLHSVWDGRGWGRPEVVTSAPPYPEYPRLSVGRGNQVNLVWFGGDKKTDRTPTGIWYSRATADAPAMVRTSVAPPVPAPAPIAPPATAIPPRAPAVAALLVPPEPVVVDAPASRQPAWLADLLSGQTFPLLAALIPVAVLLLGVLAVEVRRRLLLMDQPGDTL